jgi:hypothetical protein
MWVSKHFMNALKNAECQAPQRFFTHLQPLTLRRNCFFDWWVARLLSQIRLDVFTWTFSHQTASFEWVLKLNVSNSLLLIKPISIKYLLFLWEPGGFSVSWADARYTWCTNKDFQHFSTQVTLSSCSLNAFQRQHLIVSCLTPLIFFTQRHDWIFVTVLKSRVKSWLD